MASNSHETLENFCSWQEQLKKPIKNRTSTIKHHDIGIFLTRYRSLLQYRKFYYDQSRKSLCRDNTSCSTIGLAHMAGICMVNRSCNINQDIGLMSAYTIAHEIGHK